MKLSINWLKEYIEFNKTLDEISENLTMIGNEVESIDTKGIIPGVIVAEIKNISSHPNADKLKLAKVFDGNKSYNIVCGAPNIEEGQKIFGYIDAYVDRYAMIKRKLTIQMKWDMVKKK